MGKRDNATTNQRSRGRSRHRQRHWDARHSLVLVFLAPAGVLYATFFLLPMAQAFYVSLFRWSGLSQHRTFVGLANFRKLLGFEMSDGHRIASDPVFWKALGHNFEFLVLSLVVVIPLALFFGSALSRRVWGSRTYRAVYLFPNMISVVAVAVLWSFVYHPRFGVLNYLVSGVGLQPPANGWLGEPRTALPCIIVTSMWFSLGFYIVLLLAGIQSIPRTFYEAAEIDGAGGWQQFRHITIPLVWEMLKLAVVYLVIQTINVFGLVWVMTDGRPHRTHRDAAHLSLSAGVQRERLRLRDGGRGGACSC